MKKYICGLITGILIATSFTAFAAGLNIIKNDKPIYINGEKTDISAYAIDGSTYLKLRDFEKAGLKINYDSSTKHIEIENPALTGESNTKENNNMSTTLTKPKSTPDGITMIDEYNGKYYVGYVYANQKIIPKGYIIKNMISTGQNKYSLLKIIDNKGKNPDITSLSGFEWEVVLDNIQTNSIYGYDEIEYNYYINTILPLVK